MSTRLKSRLLLIKTFKSASLVLFILCSSILHASDLRELFYHLLLSSQPQIAPHSHIQGPLESGDIEIPEGFISLRGSLSQRSTTEPVFNLGTPELAIQEPDGSTRRFSDLANTPRPDLSFHSKLDNEIFDWQTVQAPSNAFLIKISIQNSGRECPPEDPEGSACPLTHHLTKQSGYLQFGFFGPPVQDGYPLTFGPTQPITGIYKAKLEYTNPEGGTGPPMRNYVNLVEIDQNANILEVIYYQRAPLTFGETWDLGTIRVGEKKETTLTLDLNPTQTFPSGNIQVLATARDKITNAPQSNIQVTLSVQPDPSSGGHDHNATRPSGVFSSTTCSTDSQGQCSATYTASPFGGIETITAQAEGAQPQSQNLTVTTPELVSMPIPEFDPESSRTIYTLIGETDRHLNNHYIATIAFPELQSAMLDFFNDPDIEGSETLRLNDMSLQNGGGFDIFGGWLADITFPACQSKGHCWHREGLDVDVENLNKLLILIRTFEPHGWCFIDEGQRRKVNPSTRFPHFRFKGRGQCALTR